MSENSTKGKEPKILEPHEEWRMEVTEEQYEATKAKGIEEESLFKPGTHVFRRRPQNKIMEKNQTTVVLNLDEKTFRYFQHLAQNSQTKTVESEISAELRVIAEKEPPR